MLINIYVYDLCCQATLLHWTILGTENEQLTLLQLFHEVFPLCMLKLYHVSVCVCVCVGNCSKNWAWKVDKAFHSRNLCGKIEGHSRQCWWSLFGSQGSHLVCLDTSSSTEWLDCNEPIERLYYSAKFTDICIHCSSESVSPWNDTEEFYPQCESCSEKSKIPNVKTQRKFTK